MFKKLFSKISSAWHNRSNKSKIKYLIKQGCNIHPSCHLLCTTATFGSEPYLITIGKNTYISKNVLFSNHDGGVIVLNNLNYFDGKRYDKFGLISVGENCFLGNGCFILPGVKIGDNCIIAAHAVVTKDVPSNTIVGGVPAKHICTIEEYYNKNKDRFFPTKDMQWSDKKRYLLEHIDKIK